MEKVLHISGEVGFDDNSADGFRDRLKKADLSSKDSLRLIINSEGGSVFDGFDIYNQIKSLPNNVITEVRGMAASIASLIMMAGDEIQIGQAGAVMIHRSMTMAMGNSEDIEQQTNILRKIDDIITTIYAARTGKSKEEVDELLSEETWFTGEEAVEAGLADTLVNTIDARFAALISITQKQKIMDIKKLLAGLGQTTEDTETAATEEETTQEEQPTAVTREEFDVLVEALAGMQEALESLQVEGEETEEEEETTEEETTTEETAQMTEEEIEAKIAEGVALAIAGLKTSKKVVPKGNNSMTGQPKGWVDPYASFRQEQKELDKQTRIL